MLSQIRTDKIYIVCGYTDLRQGIDGLASIVQEGFNLNPYDNCLFLFCGRRRDRIKLLLWDGDGFLLMYKRLEQGIYIWPRNTSEAKLISTRQYLWLLDGLSIDQPKAHRPFDLMPKIV